MGVEDGAISDSVTREEKECRLVYLDQDEGIWKCRHCSWTFKLLSGGMDLFQKHKNNDQVMTLKTVKPTQEIDDIEPVIISKHKKPGGIYQRDHNVIEEKLSTAVVLPHGNQTLLETKRENEWEVLKSIVYGGLIESITSLCVISSAAGVNTSTLNIVSLGLANLIGGLLIMLHHLSEIKSTAAENQNGHPADRYWKLLGKRENFRLHLSVSITSFIFFGLLPPLIYAILSAKNTNKESRLTAVATASLACIALLAIGKAHLTTQRPYIKSFVYYLGLLCTSSGVSYMAGVMIDRFLQQLNLFERNVTFTPPTFF